MKLLLDQDVYEITTRFLISLGIDIVRVSDIGLAAATDEENLKKAIEIGRIFVTRDRDYGHLVFIKKIKSGVLYLRILPSTITEAHTELERILKSYSGEQLKSAFVVVEAGRHRFRKL